MKRALLALVCIGVLWQQSFSQSADKFDIATFRSPAGWTKQVTDNSIQFSTEDKAKNTFCLITLFKSMPSLGSAKEDFDAAWSTIVTDSVGKSSPQMLPGDRKDAWEITSGYAPFEKDGGKGVVVLVTASVHEKMMVALIISNSTAYEPDINAFLASISLKKPPTAERPPVGVTDNSAIAGQWGISVSPQDSYSVNNGINGYTTREYTFYPNGTYQFLIKLFAYTSSQLLFTKETGVYTLNGNSLTITPKQGSIQAWTKATETAADGRQAQTDKWGKLVNTQSWPLERVTYQISKEYMSGTEKWQLQMRSAKPTRRDGPFTGSSAFPNTWFYETVRFPIDPPR